MPEKYLSLGSFEHRSIIAKLRTSAHKLCIETGRFNGRNQYVPPQLRTCSRCDKMVTEDEMHFMIDCPRYRDLREELFHSISVTNPQFASYNGHQKFIWLLTSENMCEIKLTATYLLKAFKRRNGNDDQLVVSLPAVAVPVMGAGPTGCAPYML